MKSIVVVTDQLPYLGKDGKILGYGGGVSRATVNVLRCLEDEYRIYIMYVSQSTPDTGKMFRYENMTYITEMSFFKFGEVYEKYFVGISFIFMIELFIHGTSLFQWKSLPHKKIGMLQTWNTDPLDIGMAGIVSNGMENKSDKSSLLFPIGCLYDSNIFFSMNQQRENFAIYTGRLDVDKNVQYLMDSWQSIYDKFGIELKMIGPYNLHKIKIPGYKYITHQIFANDTDLAKYYNTCKCFVMPSKCESFCCSLVEALACNAPCVIDGIIGSVKNFEGMDKYVCGSGREWQNRLVENIESIMSCSNVPVDSSKFVENLFSISANKTKLKTFINLCLDRPPY